MAKTADAPENKSHATSGSMKITSCKSNCQHEWQDRKYGKNMRVMNPCNKGFRCTVCGTEQ